MARKTVDPLEYIPKDERDKIPDEDFAGPHRSFPIDTQAHLDAAARLIGHADNPDAIKRKAIAIAKRKGFKLPDSWQDDDKPKENALAPSSFLPKSKVATLTTCFLQDGAISLNGRQYPAESVDKLIRSAQVQLSDPGAAPLTCYISHDAADADDSLKLVGRVTGVWREGSKAMASIDIANTHAGRDAATLAASGYLRTQSLRASNAELRREKDSTWPIVAGENLRLDGIDFTATPGIQVARIQNVALAESVTEEAAPTPQKIHEVFTAHRQDLLYEQEEHLTMLTPQDNAEEQDLTEAGNNMPGNPATSGDSPYMTNDPTKDSYGQRMYPEPHMTSGPMQGMEGNTELMEAHDRIALVQNRECAPSRESARYARALKEAGKRLSGANDAHLDVAHHAIAKHLGMECEGKDNKMESRRDPDNDGDDDSTNDRQKNPDFGLDQMESRKAPTHHQPAKGTSPMTEEEALRLLEARGYGVQKPKSPDEIAAERERALQERLEAQDKQLAEMRELILKRNAAPQEPPPQRKSQVMGANVNTNNKAKVYVHGQYLKERLLNGVAWEQLADRTAPLPEGMSLEWLIKEFADLRIVQNFDRYGWPEGLEHLAAYAPPSTPHTY